MKLAPGSTAPAIATRSIAGKEVRVPAGDAALLHLQFRRFAGCPVCNLHLRSMARRHAEVAAAGVRQVVFFHSSREEMLRYQAQLPFDCVADPDKQYYRGYGVEASLLAVLHPRVFWSGMKWVLTTGRFYRKAENGILGLPADFLVNAQGTVVASHYGRHADDHWEVEDVLEFARA